MRRVKARSLVCLQDHPTTSPPRLIVNGDSTLLVPSIQQEETKIGYAPIVRGQAPSHPSHCFEEQRNSFWQGALRQGDTQPPAEGLPGSRGAPRKSRPESAGA
ncbi:MAG: hypothetical protein CV088_11280 [Nitrospira sp. LK70]|nr:hypothetical protein [Nitrospira sp. LK70]